MKEEVMIHSSIVDVMVGEREKIIARLDEQVKRLEALQTWRNFAEERPVDGQECEVIWLYSDPKIPRRIIDKWNETYGLFPDAGFDPDSPFVIWSFWRPASDGPTPKQIKKAMEKEK